MNPGAIVNALAPTLETGAMAEPMSKPENPVLMAVIGAAHGIKGELRVKTFTGDPLALGDYGPLFAKDGRRFEILDIRPQGTVVVARFKGVGDRSAAEALTGTELFVDRAALAADLRRRGVLPCRPGRPVGRRRARTRRSARSPPCRISAAATFLRSTARG